MYIYDLYCMLLWLLYRVNTNNNNATFWCHECIIYICTYFVKYGINNLQFYNLGNPQHKVISCCVVRYAQLFSVFNCSMFHWHILSMSQIEGNLTSHQTAYAWFFPIFLIISLTIITICNFIIWPKSLFGCKPLWFGTAKKSVNANVWVKLSIYC